MDSEKWVLGACEINVEVKELSGVRYKIREL